VDRRERLAEAVVALPDQLFYITGISTYFWVVTDSKTPERRGKVQLVDARNLWRKVRKSLGEKRKELSAEHIAEITRRYGAFEEGEPVKILPNEAFGYLRVTVERPLRLRWEITEETLAAARADKKLRGRIRTPSRRSSALSANASDWGPPIGRSSRGPSTQC
jgi:type I restriction enzyme M protein